jgi:hypothetical protein
VKEPCLVERIRSKAGKAVWLDAPPHPYRIASPAPGTPFVCALFVADSAISEPERVRLSAELIAAGCRYAVCAGIECSLWHDWIDLAYLDTPASKDPKEAAYVMTAMLENEPAAEVLWFARTLTDFDDNVFEHVVVLVLGEDARLMAEIRAVLTA